MADYTTRRAIDFLHRIESGPKSPFEADELEAPQAKGRADPVTGFTALPEDKKRAVEGALDKLDRPDAMSWDEQDALEAIIIPDRRPVISIRNDAYDIVEQDWVHLNAGPARAHILKTIPAIGRVELPNHPSLPYGGTAFLVAPDLVMTNRHVAELFAQGLGKEGLQFVAGSAEMNFVAEEARPGDDRFAIDKVMLIHPYWDMALLRVRGVDPARMTPLVLSRGIPSPPGSDVVSIGYPAFDPRNDLEVQRRLFGNLFNVKRLRPGKLWPRRAVRSYGKAVEALTHDTSTLGGDSGGGLICPRTGQVVALHFGGRYLQINYAVPIADLAQDEQLLELGLNFDPAAPPLPMGGPWEEAWTSLLGRPASGAEAAAHVPSTTDPSVSGPIAIDIPITLSVRFDPARARVAVAGEGQPVGDLVTEAMVEPWRERGYRRQGYVPDFLGAEVPLPTPMDTSELATLENGDAVIPYMHFSLAMHRMRRLALFTAANVRTDGVAKRPDPTKRYTRGALSGLGENDIEKWFLDDRVRPLHQLPDRFFTKDRKAFDKGHLVRREDVAWGETYEELRIANGDTYHVTNCSPQVAGFNRANGVTNWGELEKAVLALAGVTRLSVFSGPVLEDDDPVFSGLDDIGAVRIRIPRAYWKVAVVRDGAKLAAFGFVLEQDLSQVDMEAIAFDAKWATHSRSLAELEQRIGRLRFPAILHDADRHGSDAVTYIEERVDIGGPST